jgi:hypothetical protein
MDKKENMVKKPLKKMKIKSQVKKLFLRRQRHKKINGCSLKLRKKLKLRL